VELPAALKVGYETQDIEIDERLHIALKSWRDVPHQSTPLNRTHISQQMLALVDALPADGNDYVRLPPLIAKPQSPNPATVALFPRAGNAIKEWGDGNFLNLAQRLASRDDVDTVNVYFGSQAEADSAGFPNSKKIAVHAGLDMPKLYASVARNVLCVANNSFGAHIASYLGVTVFGIYGGHETREEWGPVFGENYVIYRPVDCSPCHLPEREMCQEGMACLDVSPEFVYQKISAFLDDKVAKNNNPPGRNSETPSHAAVAEERANLKHNPESS